jgi:hypothetical protein
MKNKKKVSYSLQLMIHLQKLSSKEKQSGYALLMVSVMSILIFSMLTVYLFSSKISQSTTDAMIDSGSTFYAAEFGLNRRANDMRTKVGNFSRPSGSSPTDSSPVGSPLGTRIASMMASCLGSNNALKGTGDLACTESSTAYSESEITGSADKFSSGLRTDPNVRYKTFSFVQDITPAPVTLTIIPARDNFAGLRSTDYQYRVYSTALKQANGSTDVSAQSMLQMQFTDRFIPIFQFAAFYEGDMEIFPGAGMRIDGPIHSNANILLAPSQGLTLNGNVTYTGLIYRSLRFTSPYTAGTRSIYVAGGGPYPNSPATAANCTGAGAPGATTALPAGAPAALGCMSAVDAWGAGPFPIPISAADLTASNNSINRTGTLRLPPSGFLSKVQTNGTPGTYHDKADLRVDFDPCNSTSPCDVNNPRFNITRMNQTGGTPVIVEDFSTTIGLRESLQKPVMVNIANNISNNQGLSEVVRLCPKLDGSPGEPVATLAGYSSAMPQVTPVTSATAALIALVALPELDSSTNGVANRSRVKVALQKAIIMTDANDPSLTFTQIKQPIADTLRTNFRTALDNAGLVDTVGNPLTTARLATVKTTITGASSGVGPSSSQIAALNINIATAPTVNINGGCFLPAPMQMIRNQIDRKERATRTAGNNTLYILQSNIKSLTAWNRYGVYGDGTPPAQAALLASPTLLSADDKLFTKKTTASLAAVDQFANLNAKDNPAINVAGANCDYDCLGLGAADGVRSSVAEATSQGGMVWHYSLINRNAPYNYPSNPAPASPAVAVRTNALGRSLYGFAFSGGARLPGALTIASDQAVYVQGDYNNPSSYPGGIAPPATTIPNPDPLDMGALDPLFPRTAAANPPSKEKRPAAIMGDSAVILSNNCSDANFKLDCLRDFTAGSATIPAPAKGTTAANAQMPVATPTVVRAAILSGTEATNLGAAPVENASGLNNHIGFRENWNGITFKYRGSLVSKGIPSEFNGTFRAGCLFAGCYNTTYFFPPFRDFGFDTDFNNVDGLPPLTPNVNLLIQRVYKRDYDSLNRS